MMKNKTLFVSSLAILFSLFISFIMLWALGKSPAAFMAALLRMFFNDRNGNLLISFFMRIVPLTFTALGVAFAFRTGLFNIGAEGQFGMGLFGAVAVASLPGIPVGLHFVLVLIAGFLCGALWGWIPGFFRAYFEVHEVVITIMMNYIALYLLKGLLLPLVADPMGPHQVMDAAGSATMESLFGETRLFHVPLNLWFFLIVMFLGVAAFHFIINKTTFGFELRAGGLNEHGARYAGMKSKRNIMLSMMIAGGFAGIGGAFYVLTDATIATTGFVHTGYGFDGLAAALLGGSTALGTLGGSMILGYLSSMNTKIQQLVGIPKEITDMIVALMLLFIAMAYAFEWLGQALAKRKEQMKKDDPVETLEFPQQGEEGVS